MQLDETFSRSTHVAELFSHSRCSHCQERNRRCHVERGSTNCLQCDPDDVCIFTRTVSRTVPASAFSWSELTGLPPSAPSADEQPAPFFLPAVAVQHDRHDQASGWEMSDTTWPTAPLRLTTQAWLGQSVPAPGAGHVSPANSEVDEGDIVTSSTRDGSITRRSVKSGRRSGPLSETGRLNASRMRNVGSCIRCFTMKERVCAPPPALSISSHDAHSQQCSGGTPCERCTAVMSKSRSWSMPCLRGTLENNLPQLIPGMATLSGTER
jgi:hypothetical protein